MTSKSKYWLTLSGLLGAVVLTVGFVPAPLVFIIGGCLIIGFPATGAIHGQFQKETIRAGTLAASFPLILAILAFNAAILLRGSDAALIGVPVAAIALSSGCYWWSIDHGPYTPPRSTNTAT